MTRAIIFDSSTIISLATTCNLSAVEKLKAAYGGDFLISEAVRRETIDRAEQSKRFKYEGHRLLKLVDEGVFKYFDEEPYAQEVDKLAFLTNSAFIANGKPVHIMHSGELSMLIAAKELRADGVAVDERTTRLLIEDPHALPKLLGSKLHTFIKTDQTKLNSIKSSLIGINVIRSADLMLAAFKKDFLGKQNKDMLDGVLWALKLAGCAISGDEIEQYLRF